MSDLLDSLATSMPRPGAGAFFGIEEETETAGGRTVVRTRRERGRDIRLLLVRGTRQSAMWLDDPFGECPFPYLQTFDVAFEAEPRPKRALLIGGAGYAWPRHILTADPELQLTVAEFDPMMNELARRWFKLDELERRHGPEGDGRLSLHVGRGRILLETCAESGERFDAIFNDAFTASEPTRSLVDDEAIQLVRRCLNPGGLYVINVISALTGPQAGTLDAVCDVLATSFEQVSVVPCDMRNPQEITNCVVIGSDAGQSFSGTWMSVAGVASGVKTKVRRPPAQ